ncbi:MAG: CPBP family intramembrane metalloprotease [Myxococcales bacterium]|nr:CPBP family intramembrane metalloprotease [Myxococcales bacterium]
MKALAWSARDGQIALLLLGSAALYVVFHYGLSARALLARLTRRAGEAATGDGASAQLQARSVLISKAASGLWLGAGALALLAAVGLAPLSHGLWPRAAADFSLTPLAIALGVVVFVPFVVIAARSPQQRALYPEIRARRWPPALVLASAGAWAIYLLGYELFFRGVLLMSLADRFGAWPALGITTALYVFAHLPKPNASETASCVLMGVIFGAMALVTGAMWAPFVVHLVIAVSSETAAALWDPEVTWWAREGRGKPAASAS